MKTRVTINYWVLCGLIVLTGTLSAQPVPVGEIAVNSRGFTAVGDFVFFNTDAGLYRTDGTAEGTVLLSPARNAHDYHMVNNVVYFIAREDEQMVALWRSDGTPSGTFSLSIMKDIVFMGATSEYLFFAGWNEESGRELYRTNGHVSGTILLKDIYPGSASGLSDASLYYSPYSAVDKYRGAVLDDQLFFTGNDGVAGDELWRSDGTPGGTVVVKDINPGAEGGVRTGPLIAYNGYIYLRGDDGVHGAALWRSDGSALGTTLFHELIPGSTGIGMIEFISTYDSALYFGVGEPLDGGYQFALWRTDGSPSATVRIKDICYDCQVFSPSHEFDGTLMFFLYENYGVNILCATDGTPEGTSKLYSRFLDGNIPFSAALDEHFVFYTTSQGHSLEFLRTDGDTTSSFWRFNSGGRFADISAAEVGDLVYFADHAGPGDTFGEAIDPKDNMQVLVTDGERVSALRDLFGTSFANASELVNYNDQLMFTTLDSTGSRIIWLYDAEATSASFTIVNADTDEDLQVLREGDVFEKTPDLNINIRYNPVIGQTPAAVVFKHQGKVVRRESEAPFSLRGDYSSDYLTWEEATPGIHVIEAIPYSDAGEAGSALAVRFTIRIVEPCAAEGVITYEKWNGVLGTEVSRIPVYTEPSDIQILSSFESPANQGANYGSRIRGYICPPQTGYYTFWITSNDHSELWLSTDEDPANMQRIAWLTRAVDPGEWEKYGTQRSMPIALEQGRSYYIEALHKQGIGTDHLSIGWQLPDGMQQRPIAGDRLSPFESQSATMARFADGADTELKIFPNPVRSDADELTILATQPAAIAIHRLTGEVVYARESMGQGNTIPAGVLAPGVYVIHISREGRQTTKRLLVN